VDWLMIMARIDTYHRPAPPRQRRGETVKAVVVPKPGAELTEDGIITWARDHMAAYKVPRSVELASDLPRSGSGKILWRVLQEREDALA